MQSSPRASPQNPPHPWHDSRGTRGRKSDDGLDRAIQGRRQVPMAKTLQPWSHVQPLEDFQREIDELFSRFVGGRGRTAGPILTLPPIESFLDGSEYVIRLDLPGIEPKDIEVTVTADVVIVRAA